MCGRFTLHSKDRIKLKGLASLDLPFEARYNIAPSQRVLTIGDFGTGLIARLTTWGLIPSWSTDGKGFINARAETLEEKPSFSESFRLRRCLIPADGFFEAYRQREASFLIFRWMMKCPSRSGYLGYLEQPRRCGYFLRHHYHRGKRISRRTS